MPINTDQKTALQTELDRRLKQKKLSMHSLSKRAGLSESGIRDIFRGKNLNPSYTTLSKIAMVLGCSVEELYGADSQEEMEVAGYIGSGAKVLLVKGDKIAKPLGVDPKISKLWIVKGDDNYPYYQNGDMVVTPHEYKFIPDLLGRECILQTSDNSTYLRIIQPGKSPNSYALTGFNAPPISDVQIEWALPIFRTFKNMSLAKNKGMEIG